MVFETGRLNFEFWIFDFELAGNRESRQYADVAENLVRNVEPNCIRFGKPCQRLCRRHAFGRRPGRVCEGMKDVEIEIKIKIERLRN